MEWLYYCLASADGKGRIRCGRLRGMANRDTVEQDGEEGQSDSSWKRSTQPSLQIADHVNLWRRAPSILAERRAMGKRNTSDAGKKGLRIKDGRWANLAKMDDGDDALLPLKMHQPQLGEL